MKAKIELEEQKQGGKGYNGAIECIWPTEVSWKVNKFRKFFK